MPAHRKPLALARASGSITANPARFAGRLEPKSDALGAASSWMVAPHQLQAWRYFLRECPWLQESDRALVEIAVTIRSRLIAGEEVGLSALILLRQCLCAMGASPADRSRVSHIEEKAFDPTSVYFS